jgi:hypothetical protein
MGMTSSPAPPSAPTSASNAAFTEPTTGSSELRRTSGSWPRWTGRLGRAGPINESMTKVGAALLALGIAPESFALSRAAGLTPEGRALYRSILEGFSSGEAPTLAALAGAGGGEAETLRSRLLRLQTADLIDLDGGGEVALAYPFSARPTRQRVDTVDGRRLWACCAIDALGIPSMLGASATVHGSEPDGGGEVKVSLEPSGEPSWQPTQALVLAARAGEGSSACCACPHINFFTSPSNADRELAAHPELSGTTLSLPEATIAGRLLFGGLLSELENA